MHTYTSLVAWSGLAIRYPLLILLQKVESTIMPGYGVTVLTDYGFFSPVWNQYVQNWFRFSYLQFTLERQKTAEKERLFLVYAKQWWREYLQIRPTHNTRLVKIFAQVCKFYKQTKPFFVLSFCFILNFMCMWNLYRFMMWILVFRSGINVVYHAKKLNL